MAITNKDRISRLLDAIVAGLGPYVARELQRHLGNDFGRTIANDTRLGINEGSLKDPQVLLKVVELYWRDVFGKTLGRNERAYVNELWHCRNDWAHGKAFTYEDTERALDTGIRLLKATSASEQAEKLEGLRTDLRRTVFDEQRRQQERRQQSRKLEGEPKSGLTPWREIIQPHPDVATGRFSEAEFAADLAAVHRGDASPEYGDPGEFFRRTYLTEGLSTLLREAMRRFRGEGGDPVVELQTNFGGGKTHSMLALYHLVEAADPQTLHGVDELMAKSGIDALPAKINRAVLVGTALSPASPRTHEGGHVTRTLWGEMAFQLAGDIGLSLVEASDRTGSAPGSDQIVELLQLAAPCLVLIDEWVAFIRQLYTVHDLPAGSFDANVSFAQALTEAVKHVPGALLVASLPASQIEIGGEGGQAALERLQQTFGRVESSWRPANVDEGFEIVRRRLFEPIADADYPARDAVVKAYFDHYREGGAQFPRECSEPEYKRRLESAYPIHPELFDRLNNDWGALERFQRTRGVLRLMATVINALWEQGDKSLMIMPASLPMDDERVQVELTRYLESRWDSIIATDIDGPAAHAPGIDRDNPNLQRYGATRRVARALFLASAPQVAGRNLGVDDRRVKLAAAQAGEPAGVFGDALRLLADRATYLYTDGGRYWFDTQPTVTRLADDRASLLEAADVRVKLVERLQEDKDRGPFSAMHVAPKDSGEVPDEMPTRLVVLGPEYFYATSGESKAQAAAEEILTKRGGTPRIYRNALLFMAPDRRRLGELEQAVRMWLAWKSIDEEKEALNLNEFQRRQAASKREEWDRTVVARRRETWIWALSPYQPDPLSAEIAWETNRANGQESLADRAAKRFETQGVLFAQLGAQRVKDALDQYDLWQGADHLGTKALWGYFATYLYLPRLADRRLLEQAIRSAISTLTPGPFAYAEAYDEEKSQYLGLHATGAGGVPIVFDDRALVVKAEAAERQLARQKPPTPPDGPDQPTPPDPTPPEHPGQPPETTVRKRFFASVDLNEARAVRQLGDIKQEVLDHLARPGAKVKLRLEIEAESTAGFDDDAYRVVTENCRTLNIRDFGFDE
jgi:predicted AAA+ superfamily ATPase